MYKNNKQQIDEVSPLGVLKGAWQGAKVVGKKIRDVAPEIAMGSANSTEKEPPTRYYNDFIDDTDEYDSSYEEKLNLKRDPGYQAFLVTPAGFQTKKNIKENEDKLMSQDKKTFAQFRYELNERTINMIKNAQGVWVQKPFGASVADAAKKVGKVTGKFVGDVTGLSGAAAEKGVLGKIGFGALHVLGSPAARIYSAHSFAQDAKERLERGDTTGAAISGIGAASNAFPGLAGSVVGGAAAGINYLRDNPINDKGYAAKDMAELEYGSAVKQEKPKPQQPKPQQFDSSFGSKEDVKKKYDELVKQGKINPSAQNKPIEPKKGGIEFVDVKPSDQFSKDRIPSQKKQGIQYADIKPSEPFSKEPMTSPPPAEKQRKKIEPVTPSQTVSPYNQSGEQKTNVLNLNPDYFEKEKKLNKNNVSQTIGL